MAREPAKNFTDLIVWQKAHRFVLGVYQATKKFPKEEMYGLTSQFRRAAVSMPANIAEGFRKKSINDKCRFLEYSRSSLEECRYYLILGNDLGYLDKGKMFEQLEEVSKLLYGYSKALKT